MTPETNQEFPGLKPWEIRKLRILVLAAFLLLALGLVSPIVTLEKFVLFENTFSVLSGLVALLKEGQVFLFLIIGGFSILLPILKLCMLFKLVDPNPNSRMQFQKHLKLMHDYGKWSMLDVFIVAVMVVAVKLGAIANIKMRFGLYAFAAAVLLTMYVTAKIVWLGEAERSNSSQNKDSGRHGT
jgi:paraquat-inducible protein A